MTRPILIIRHPTVQNRFYDVVTDWVREHAPGCTDLLDVQNLPYEPADWRDVRLLVIWLQDPIEAWSPQAYAEAEQLATQCDRLGIPVINRVSRSSYLSKSNAAPLVATAGFRVPRMARITSPEAFREDFCGLSFPLFVRDDRVHGSPMSLARSAQEARQITFDNLYWPVAVEYIDVRSASDGLFRKYRYFACGKIGVAQHVQASDTWITRGSGRIVNDRTKAQELYYISQQDPNHMRFQIARRALGLEMCAFDYGYGANGEVVVWEVNPFPFIQFAKSETLYRNRAIHRSVAAMLAMYLGYARLPVPASLVEWISY